MKYSAINHPTEDSLVSFALQLDGDEEVRKHLDDCQECMEYIDEIRMIGKDIEKIEEQEIPSDVQNKILSIARKKTGMENVSLFLRDWYKKPFLYGLFSALGAVMFYLIFEFFL